jgi:dipeptidyl aminopeptidase/acylaminoacyl peptidase
MAAELRVDDATPWKQRFRTPVVLRTSIARNAPTAGLAVSNRSGVYQLYAWDVPTGGLTQVTDRPEGILFGILSPDGRYVYYLDDRQGNEIGHFVRIPFAGGAPQDVTSDLPPYSPAGFAVSQAGNCMGLTVADPEGYHLYVLDLGPDGTVGAPRPLYHSTKAAFGPTLSHGGEIAVMASTERTGKPQFSLLAFDTASGAQSGELWDGPDSSIQPSAFAPLAGDARLLATTNRTGLKRPLLWDPRTGERMDLALADLDGEIEAWDWSSDGRRLLLCQANRAVQQLYTYELESGALTRLQHPGGSFWAAYFTLHGDIFAQWEDATHPTRLIALDGHTGVQTRTVLAAGEVPPGHPWRSVTFRSSDGQEIQGWLGLPDDDGPFPTILETHGGPTAVTTESFSPQSQAWLDHGFAFLTINYRGSTTFGRAFEEQIWGDRGHWEVEDMVAARDWLVQQGIARRDQVLLTGWSYGGYLTLLALGKRPDLWAGGMAGIAIADWALQYEDSADALKGVIVAFFEGTPEEKPAQYVASSPITYVENVSAPVLIIQGRNDTWTPARPVEVYEQKMRALGKPIEVHWYDAGHLGSFAQVEPSIQHQELMLRFAYRVIHGLETA